MIESNQFKEKLSDSGVYGDPDIYSKKCDENSIYTLIYMTSVIHQDVDELKNTLIMEYNRIRYGNNKSPSIKETQKEKDRLEQHLKRINLTPKEDDMLKLKIDSRLNKYKNELRRNSKKEENFLKKKFYFISDWMLSKHTKEKIKGKLNRKLFLFILMFAILSAIFQTVYILSVMGSLEDANITNNLIIFLSRCFALIGASTLTVKEFTHARRKLNHSLFQGFLYVGYKRRIVSFIFSVIQIVNAFLAQHCFAMLVATKNSVVGSISAFSCFFVLLNIDDWFGSFCLKTNKRIGIYLRDYTAIIWCFDRKKWSLYSFARIIEGTICGLMFINSFRILLHSYSLFSKIAFLNKVPF